VIKSHKNAKKEVSCLGTCSIDFISHVSRLAKADDEVNVDKLHVSLGGSASNFVTCLSQLGVNISILANVGDDNFGEIARQQLSQKGVDIKRLITIKGRTGMAFIAVDDDAERSIYTYMGSNADFKLEKEDLNYIKSSDIVHITGMYYEVVEEASKHAKVLSFNPGSILSSFGLGKLNKIIKRTDILFLNKKEVTLLTNMKIDDGTRFLIELGVPIVVVTMGKDGAMVYTSEEVIKTPAKPVKALDTTGAGDVFAAGFLASFLKDQDLKECLHFANQLAAQCVENLGGTQIIISTSTNWP
jgi:alpha-D-ribose-1-phosphate 5-kinase (ATP)